MGFCATLLWAQGVPVSPSTPPRLVEQYTPELNAVPQETTASLGKSKAAVIHQWGIIRIKADRAGGQAAIDRAALPDFVHTTATAAELTDPRLEFSALYVHPPMMMHGPMSFDIRTGIRDGSIAAWYPFAPQVGNPNPRVPDSFNSQITWKKVLAGAQADTLKTTNELWMLARSVEAPATLKVYKPGPPGTRPDDPGTTEGEVFLYVAGSLSGRYISLAQSASGEEVSFHLKPNVEGLKPGMTRSTEPLYGWIISPAGNNDAAESYHVGAISHKDDSEPVLETTAASVISADTVRAKLNEAFAGHGLDSDEADALTRMILEMTGNQRHGVVILPSSWVESVFPLEISGSSAESPVRVFVAVCALPAGTLPAKESKL